MPGHLLWWRVVGGRSRYWRRTRRPGIDSGLQYRAGKKVLFRQFKAGVEARATLSRVKTKKTGLLFTTCMD
jgi:hypothetical protein